ncbi:sensor histidine kinase [Rugamonas sp. CCM 8940]|uniref:sensor histidine kinase n=1 Tax=Rugamonas sp. CCM 8940 TaxID=2765359 RepID=UPI001F27F813|nr:histidine kinase [Rugamonas sp. CCM 8940]
MNASPPITPLDLAPSARVGAHPPPPLPPVLQASGREYWLAQCAGWGTLALAAVITSASDSGAGMAGVVLIKWLSVASGLVQSHLWHALLRRRAWLERKGWRGLAQIAAALAGMGVVQAAVVVGANVVVQDGSILKGDAHVGITLFALSFMWFGIFFVWTLCYGLVLARRRALRLEFDKLQVEVSLKDAQLRALQAQINPHFFFNSLNSIRSLVYDDAAAAAQAIGRLSAMMRHNLVAGQLDSVRLADELAAVDAYLGMEKLRFEQRLQVSVEIEAGLDGVCLPGMILQTLVENAVKYGVEPVAKPCQIRISARAEGGRLALCVANQGRLAGHSGSTRLGLANANRRLALRYGAQARCELSERDGWVLARMVLPMERG